MHYLSVIVYRTTFAFHWSNNTAFILVLAFYYASTVIDFVLFISNSKRNTVRQKWPIKLWRKTDFKRQFGGSSNAVASDYVVACLLLPSHMPCSRNFVGFQSIVEVSFLFSFPILYRVNPMRIVCFGYVRCVSLIWADLTWSWDFRVLTQSDFL